MTEAAHTGEIAMNEHSERTISTAEAVVTIRNLKVDFAKAYDNAAVDDVSLEVRPGEIVALVGESGAGKTTTAKAVIGLLPAYATVTGSVKVRGTEVVGLDERGLQRIRGTKVAMVFQEPATALNPVERIGWQIGEALRAHRKISKNAARARAIELLTAVEINDPETRAGHYPHQLSGGERQRVVIALALANEPDLIIADEPTTALDVTVQAEILRLLREVRDRFGRAVLLVTHNLGVVADLADRVVVMRHGKIVEQGGVHDIFARPQAEYTKQLLAAVPRFDRLPEERPVEVAPAPDDLLRFTDLDVTYPGGFGRKSFRAIRGVNLTMARGEVVGLVGESGSGKTTLGKVAVGLLRPSAGGGHVLGEDISAIKTAQWRALRRRIGVVFQDPTGSLDPLRTAGDAIAEPLVIHGVMKGKEVDRRVAQLLESVQLPASYGHRRPDELSGGEKQRIGLARAIALGPDLVIADEPTSALDVSVQADILSLFADLRQEYGFGCLFISHDLAVVDEVADRVVVLKAGEVVEQGTPAKVLRAPETDYARRLIQAIPVPDPVEQRKRHSLEPVG
jgi:peptide/nickel transport system ATP-binding protein